jgi:hypothetical protein
MRRCVFELNHGIHGSSFFPAELILVVAGPEETKDLAGKDPPPDSDPSKQVRPTRQAVKL